VDLLFGSPGRITSPVWFGKAGKTGPADLTGRGAVANAAGTVRIFLLLLSAFLSVAVACGQDRTKILLVVAHPDDEYYFAATVYRLAVQRDAEVDEIVITDGEGGYRYSTLAEPYYRKALTDESVGRKELPAIRRKETINAGRILGVNRHFFLNQKDQRFTTDEEDGIKGGWNAPLILNRIAEALKRTHYQFIFCILPRSTTHGHHQAAAALAATAAHNLPQNTRPVLLGFDTDATPFTPAAKVHSPEQWETNYAYAFDRTARFGFHRALSYQIVVDWMIAEHKSQGLLQTWCEKDPTEYIWIDKASNAQARAKAQSLFGQLNPQSDGPHVSP
jgi:N-acetylglucosamine malate deacetylase 2